jgi:hypothetical protein
MPRTTLNIEPSVLDELKKLAHKERRPLGEVASDLIRRALKAPTPPAPKFEWKVYDLGEPAVDINSNAALFAFFDREALEGTERGDHG